MNDKLLETERLYLRAFEPTDVEALLQIWGNAEVTKYLPGGKPRTREQVEKKINTFIGMFEERGFGLAAVLRKEDDKLIGYCGIMPLADTGEVEIAYGMGREFWGKGYATEIARAVLRHGFEILNHESIAAVVRPENIPSQHVLIKIGMQEKKEVHLYNMDLLYFNIRRKKFEAEANKSVSGNNY